MHYLISNYYYNYIINSIGVGRVWLKALLEAFESLDIAMIVICVNL